MTISILIILLGCHINHIIMDRVNTAIKFANYYSSNIKYYEIYHYNISWFLTGGIKNKNENTITEAEKMKNLLLSNNSYNYNWNYIIDDVSTNTAQNFIMTNNISSYYDFKQMYVVTSEFHYDRANKIADLIDDNGKNKYNWVLSPKEDRDSRYWEIVHMKNIENDVANARRNLLI